MRKVKPTIFENIKRARVASGISQKELAHKLGLSDKTVSAYETGRAIPPSPTLFTIAQITQTSITSLLGENDNETEEKELLSKLDQVVEKLISIDRELKLLNKSNKLT